MQRRTRSLIHMRAPPWPTLHVKPFTMRAARYESKVVALADQQVVPKNTAWKMMVTGSLPKKLAKATTIRPHAPIQKILPTTALCVAACVICHWLVDCQSVALPAFSKCVYTYIDCGMTVMIAVPPTKSARNAMYPMMDSTMSFFRGDQFKGSSRVSVGIARRVEDVSFQSLIGLVDLIYATVRRLGCDHALLIYGRSCFGFRHG